MFARSSTFSFWRRPSFVFFRRLQWNLDITVLGITNDFFTPEIVKCMKKNLDTTKPRYSEQILPVRWPFVISRFFLICFAITGVRKKNRGSTVLWFWVTSFPGVNSLRDSSPVLVRSSLSRNTGGAWLMDFRKSPSSDFDDSQGRLAASLRVSYFSDRMETSDDRKYVYIRRLERGGPELD